MAIAPAALLVHLGVQMVILTSLKVAKALPIVNNAGEATIVKDNRFWFLAQAVCTAHLEL